jgi:general secretion pathway protein J
MSMLVSGPVGRRRFARAFTLIEMVVALAVFAVIGVISAQLVNRVVDHQSVLSERAARLIEVQRAMHFLKRDVMQMVTRSVKDEFGDSRDALLIDNDGIIEFTRSGWRNPLRQPRANLQRVAYAVEDDTLKRYYWNVLDRDQDSRRFEQTLLTDVRDVEFLLVDDTGNTHGFWLPPKPAGVQPRAILLRMELPPYGFIERIWEFPGAG